MSGSQLQVIVGVPNAEVGGHPGAGAVYVLMRRGCADRRRVHGMVVTQRSPGVPGAPEDGDRFGAAVAGSTTWNLGIPGEGYFGKDVMFVGVPGEDTGGLPDTGAVQQLFPTGPGYLGGVRAGQDRFGATVG